MKKKILFYGNCQLACISRALQLQPGFNEKYEVLKALEYGLPSIWIPEVGTVAAWMYAPGSPGYPTPTPESIKSVNKIVEDSDVIIFQNIKKAPQVQRPIEFTTEYIHEAWRNKKQMICAPSFWFSGYLTDPNKDKIVFPYLFLWLLQKKLTNSDILDFFKNSSHPNISKLIEFSFKDSFGELERRQKDESSTYNTFISILDILSQYKTNFLCYAHSHPSEFYFEFLFKKIIQIIDPELNQEKIKLDIDVEPPGPGSYPFPLDFHFFKENFPNIIGCNENKYKIKLNKKFVDEQINFLNKILTESPEFLNSPGIKNKLEILDS